MKYYYENLLQNQNHTARPNIAWVADITHFEIKEKKEVFIFICVDIYSNQIVASVFRNKTITSSEIVKELNKAVEKRIPIKPRAALIIHTDRGTQFTSQTYNDFVKENEGFIIPSMSRAAMPKDNPVAERFMRTFKQHKINNKTFQEELIDQIENNPKFKAYRKLFFQYIKSLNLKPNRKSKDKSPERYDLDVSTATMLMVEPKYSKAYSEHYGTDYRRAEIDRYKAETEGVISLLDEIAAKRAEVVDKTPFDYYEDNLALQVIDERLKDIYGLLKSNPEITREYVEQALYPIQDMIEILDEKVTELLPKTKKRRTTLPLRDPINTELFDIFRNAAGSTSKYKQDLRCSQLKIAYTILFYTGLRVNEIRFFKQQDIQDAIKTSQFSTVHFKQKEPHIHVISDKAVKALRELKPYTDTIFIKYKYKYIFGKNKPIREKYLIDIINKDLKNTCEVNQIPYNIKSHSFRINMVSKLLQKTSVQNAADIIGHKDIKSTMAYKRYALNKTEIQKLLDDIEQ